ncbi:MAG: aminotransferase class I/II-fold pyridoxal phosphate-dependent enzyme [Sphingobacteriales bacterium]|nr:MAG: aminotransferase class I/II-fold pyridoxal phosphate-dependent enzyme [Sphingobacteriales bacterium]
MTEQDNLGFDTVCVHGGHQEDGHRAHLTPIYATSTYTYDSVEQAVNIFKGDEKGYIYGRFGNPTINEAEDKIAMMEAYGLKDSQGNQLQLKAILHASGMGAITTMVLANVKAGEKIITHQSLYGGTQELIDKVLPGLGIETIIVDFHDLAKTEEAIKADKSISMMYVETPANPTLQCVDLEALTALAKQHGLTVCADNTFATPYLQQPFKYDVDFVMHSTTKFLNGHGTAVGGIVIGRDLEKMNGIVTKTHRLLGGNSNAFEAYLLTNGLRTFSLRMERHCGNAEKVATYLNEHAAVSWVNYLGLESHPDYAIGKKQMKHPGAMLSFELKGGFDAGVKFINSLKLCTSAVSLGTCDTLVVHAASTTHVGVPRDKRVEYGITDGLIRMSVGIENVEDIIADIEQALS